MMTKHLIYPYIGAYKSIINAINFFGYNDLQLNEYYRNVNPESENFSKLFKVEIPDIFDNSVEGWKENDFIKGTYPNENYEETKLFNLTYNITDKDGNNVLDYTLDEVIIKLQGLKYWLKNNIIPLTHEIEDITGKAYVKTSDYIQHRLHDIRIINIRENMTPITFKMNEVYLMPVNSGSTVYNCSIDFYSIIKGVGKEEMLIDPVDSIENTELKLPDSFDVIVKTYKTYKEWEAFKSYNKGDKVKYFDIIYESVNDGNRTNNPRKYDSALPWSPNTLYGVGTIVLYDRNYYSYRGENNVSSQIPPSVNPQSWLNISQWIKIDLEPVQRITELRKGNNLLPYSFTVDSNIDPFIVIEVTSDNGYGEIYRDIKNYELKGLNDLGMSSVNQIDSLPSLRSPLTPVYDIPVQKPETIYYTYEGLSKRSNGTYFDNGSYRLYEKPDGNNYFQSQGTQLTPIYEYINQEHDQNINTLYSLYLVDIILIINEFGVETYKVSMRENSSSVIGTDKNDLYFINIIKQVRE